jgi:hypothetical protein
MNEYHTEFLGFVKQQITINRFVLQILGKVVKRNNRSGSYIFNGCSVHISILPSKRMCLFKRASWASSLIYALFYEGAIFT